MTAEMAAKGGPSPYCLCSPAAILLYGPRLGQTEGLRAGAGGAQSREGREKLLAFHQTG